jgi:hypothetical protein
LDEHGKKRLVKILEILKIKNFVYIAETDSFVDEANMERDNNRR